jgi:two-component system KDP operon response regulator KdpE
MPKLLIVDDEPEMIQYTKPILEQKGFTVSTAETVKDAIEIYPKENPDIVLLDLGLPDGDGRLVLKDIKAKAPNIKVVIISGYSDPKTRGDLAALGADDFLGKPVIPVKLPDILNKVLNKK